MARTNTSLDNITDEFILDQIKDLVERHRHHQGAYPSTVHISNDMVKRLAEHIEVSIDPPVARLLGMAVQIEPEGIGKYPVGWPLWQVGVSNYPVGTNTAQTYLQLPTNRAVHGKHAPEDDGA